MTSRILLVEDDLDIRESIKDVLEDEGYLVAEASNGLEALDQLRSALPDLILLDLMMPTMNGIQFRQEMAKDPVWAAIPIVILSADADARLKAESLQAVDVLEKPVELDRLFQTVARTLRSSDERA
ncbi:MAG TPA: response regulator [Polyangiales bacterium]|nr:response regulator [Polyangiales bacterium]